MWPRGAWLGAAWVYPDLQLRCVLATCPKPWGQREQQNLSQ